MPDGVLEPNGTNPARHAALRLRPRVLPRPGPDAPGGDAARRRLPRRPRREEERRGPRGTDRAAAPARLPARGRHARDHPHRPAGALGQGPAGHRPRAEDQGGCAEGDRAAGRHRHRGRQGVPRHAGRVRRVRDQPAPGAPARGDRGGEGAGPLNRPPAAPPRGPSGCARATSRCATACSPSSSTRRRRRTTTAASATCGRWWWTARSPAGSARPGGRPCAPRSRRWSAPPPGAAWMLTTPSMPPYPEGLSSRRVEQLHAMGDLTAPIFTDEETARAHLEAQRWPDGPVCPHCGAIENITKLQGKAHRPGLYRCKGCKKQFTVTVGTVYERSHIPLHKWVLASHLMCASKKGMSAHQLHRMLDLPYKTAWFMAHRIRASMAGAANDPEGLGGPGKIVEADETYFGNRENPEPSPQRKGRPFTKGGKSGPAGKRSVVALVERKGKARTFHVDHANAETVTKLLRENASRKSKLMTDESRLYTEVGTEYARHGTVNHSAGEYVGFDDPEKHTNTVEGYFSIFKRGMKSVYQHCGEQHLHRYLAEFEFRYNTRVRLGVGDVERAGMIVAGGFGKRLMYRRPDVSAYTGLTKC